MHITTTTLVLITTTVLLIQSILTKGVAASSPHSKTPTLRLFSPHNKSNNGMLAVRGGGGEQDNRERMPSLFGPEEVKYDRYAAAVAATEGLRKMRDQSLADAQRGGDAVSRFTLKPKGNQMNSKQPPEGEQDEAQKRISAEYVVRCGGVLKELGMSVTQYNQLGRQVNQDTRLKEKVMEQAYLYRLSATLEMDRVPLVEDKSAEDLLSATRRRRVDMFCESMVEIEDLRTSQMSKLEKALKVDNLPKDARISDPSIMPYLSPKVRAVIEAFPLQAEEIVKQYGLNSDEFNRMMEETKSNPVFRYKVAKRMKEHKNTKK